MTQPNIEYHKKEFLSLMRDIMPDAYADYQLNALPLELLVKKAVKVKDNTDKVQSLKKHAEALHAMELNGGIIND